MVNDLKYKKQLAHLSSMHRSIEGEISGLISSRVVDQLKVQRLKKQKLKIKEMISSLQNKLNGDIVA
jgi:hypothetical protein